LRITSAHASRATRSLPTLNVIQLPRPTTGSASPLDGIGRERNGFAGSAPKPGRASVPALEAYAKARSEFRERVLAHKKPRTVHLGDHVTLIFEDELTVRYQIQEMLRVEKVFEEAGIRDELDAYNPLVPDGTNFKATMLIEYEDPADRMAALERLVGIERRVWVGVEGCPRVHAIADEDLPRETETKTAAVHFLRFELDPAMVSALRRGASLGMGIDHARYEAVIPAVAAATREALLADLA